MSNQVYVWIAVVFIVLIVISFAVLMLSIFRGEKKEEGDNPPKNDINNKLILIIDIIAIILDLLALFFVPVKELLANCDTAVEACYEEAEALYDRSSCQEAKELYKLIAFTGYKDCREKIVRCDYISSKYYLEQSDYAKAFALLFPYLSAEAGQDGAPIYGEMRGLLENAAQEISAANQANQMLVDSEWMLGAWSDQLGHYIDFDTSAEEIFVRQNLYNQSSGDCRYKMSHGVYSIRKTSREDWETKLVFYPVSLNESYVYDVSDGKMYFLTRRTDPA